MKRIFASAAVIILVMVTTLGFAQTTVTGHVFAEVVEPLSASALIQPSISIKRNNVTKVDLAQVNVKSAASASCSLLIGKAILTGNNNQRIALETSASSSQKLEGNAINGYQSISLQGQPTDQMLDNSSNSYQGNLDIVLAYN